ncbi:MAG TPA: hypothetical protein VFQ77_13520 [Pseudonocardiaceae bacterium]|jgi:hypothetical protein|nr:hypothetical protein [Pseudonocardiaceae bacterium]
MTNSNHDDYWTAEEVPLPVMHAVQAAEAIREATYRMHRMQLARGVPERLDTPSLAAVGAAFEDLTRGLAQFAGQVAGSLPETLDQHPTASREIRDGLVAFRIAVLDASAAARSLGSSAPSTEPGTGRIPPQRRR